MRDFRTLLACALSLTAVASAQVVINVPSGQPGIQAALNVAANGDTIRVAPGTYVGNLNFLGKDVRLESTGGAAVTTISGFNLAPCITFTPGSTTAAVVDGFTIAFGLGRPGIPSMPSAGAGGIEIVGSSPTIRNCIIEQNRGGNTLMFSSPGPVASNGGPGGVGITNGAPLFEDCIIRSNTGSNAGSFLPGSAVSNLPLPNGGAGGIQGGHPLLRRCVIENNTGGNGGPGTIVSNQIMTPGGPGAAGGLEVESVDMRQCIVRGNVGGNGGAPNATWGTGPGSGGVEIHQSTAVTSFLRDSIIADNVSGFAAAPSNASLVSYFYAGGIAGENVDMARCTVTRNVARPSASPATAIGGMRVSGSITSSIVHGNSGTPGSTAQVGEFIATLFFLLPLPTVTHSDIEGGFAGTGNFNADPLFRSPATGDFHLTFASPCIDVAPSASASSTDRDIDGEPRSIRSAPDVGADEFLLSSCAEGSVPGPGGTFQRVLRINGSAGTYSGFVHVDVGASLSISLSTPMQNVMPSSWLLFGWMGIPSPTSTYVVGGGIGELCFSPDFVVPVPETFTVADSANVYGPTGHLDGNPTPWLRNIPGIPYAFDATIQGVVEISPGVYRTTNAIVISID